MEGNRQVAIEIDGAGKMRMFSILTARSVRHAGCRYGQGMDVKAICPIVMAWEALIGE